MVYHGARATGYNCATLGNMCATLGLLRGCVSEIVVHLSLVVTLFLLLGYVYVGLGCVAFVAVG